MSERDSDPTCMYYVPWYAAFRLRTVIGVRGAREYQGTCWPVLLARLVDVFLSLLGLCHLHCNPVRRRFGFLQNLSRLSSGRSVRMCEARSPISRQKAYVGMRPGTNKSRKKSR
eukprot:1215348-Rhodomonas_salina.5